MSPCPCCACPEVYVADVEDGMLTVACPRCGMSGPISVDGDEAEAVRGWEFLCSKLCTHCRRVYIKRIVDLKKRISYMEGIQNERKAQ